MEADVLDMEYLLLSDTSSVSVSDSRDHAELGETTMKLSTALDDASVDNSPSTVTLRERRSDCADRRKRSRKSRLFVKSEQHSSEVSSFSKAHSPEVSLFSTSRHSVQRRRQLPSPDTSPIHLLPFSPSQVSTLSP